MNQLDNVLNQMQAERNRSNALTSSLADAIKGNPDEYARMKEWSAASGVDIDLVSGDFRQEAQEAHYLKTNSIGKLWEQNPLTAQALTDPDIAGVAHDDVENMGLLERTVRAFLPRPQSTLGIPEREVPGGAIKWVTDIPKDFSAGWEVGKLQDEQGLLGFKAQTGTATQADFQRIAEIDTYLKQHGGVGGFAKETAKILGQMSQSMPQAVEYGAATGLAAGGAGMLAGPGAPVSVPTLAIGGFFAGMSAKSAEHSYKVEAGANYLDMINAGVDRDVAVNVSAGVGLVNASLEVVGMGAVAAPIKRALIREVTQEISAVMLKPTVRAAVINFGKSYGKAWGGEVSTEILQEMTAMAGEEIGRSISKEEMESKLATPEGRAEIAQRLGQVFESVGKGMAVLALPGASINFRSDLKAAAESKRDTEFLDSLSKQAGESKVRKRSPDVFESFIAGQLDGTPAENVYIDAQQMQGVLNQSGVTREQLAKVLPDVAAQIDEAVATGADVVIPTATYTTHVAGTQLGDGLRQHLRLRQEAISPAEVMEFERNKEALRRQSQDLLEQQQEANEAFVKSAREVENTLFEEIKATGQYSPSVSRNYAEFVRDFVVTQSHELGIMPADFYARYKYQVRVADGAQVEGGQFGQAEAVFWTEVDGKLQVEPKKGKGPAEAGPMNDALRPLSDYESDAQTPPLLQSVANPLAEGNLPDTIDVDGVQRPTTNGNGQPIHPTEEGVRNFWRWFGDSPNVDDDGSPIIFYHGGESSFSQIQSKGRFGQGIFVRQGKPSEYGNTQYALYLRAPILELEELGDLLNDSDGTGILESLLPDADQDAIKLVAEALATDEHYPESQEVWDAIGAIDEADAQ